MLCATFLAFATILIAYFREVINCILLVFSALLLITGAYAIDALDAR